MAGRARLLRAAFCAAATLPLVTAPAAAAGAVTALDMAWYTSTNVSAGIGLGDPYANSTFTTGDLPVGAVGQQEHKRSYLKLGVPEGAVRVVIELPLSDTTGANIGAAGPILACPLAEPYVVSSGGDIANAPEVDCESGVTGELQEDAEAGAYRFDLTSFLPRWRHTGEQVLALVADVSEPQGFYQTTFHAQIGDSVGTAEVGPGGDGTNATPPTVGFTPPMQPPAFDPASPPSLSSGTTSVDATDEAPGPVAADPSSSEEPSGGQPLAQQPLAFPPAAVNVLPWTVGLTVGLGALVAAGRSLAADAARQTPIDRLLGR